MLIWYAAGAVAAIAVGWLAAAAHASGYAPIGLVPLAVGIVLGIILFRFAASRHDRRGSRPQLLLGTITLALISVLAEHAWLYRDFRQQWHKARSESAQVAMFRPKEPWSPREYFAHELTARRAALWCLDAALLSAAAVGTVWILNRNQQQFGVAADAKATPTSDL